MRNGNQTNKFCFRRLYSILVLLLSLTSCSHTMRGTVAMKVNDEQAHIGLGSTEVKEGDHVRLFKNECTRETGPWAGRWAGQTHGTGLSNDSSYARGPACRKVDMGSATVTRVLNEQYSIVQVDPGVRFEEGMIVEKR